MSLLNIKSLKEVNFSGEKLDTQDICFLMKLMQIIYIPNRSEYRN